MQKLQPKGDPVNKGVIIPFPLKGSKDQLGRDMLADIRRVVSAVTNADTREGAAERMRILADLAEDAGLIEKASNLVAFTSAPSED